jgi:hypothetical protein
MSPVKPDAVNIWIAKLGVSFFCGPKHFLFYPTFLELNLESLKL